MKKKHMREQHATDVGDLQGTIRVLRANSELQSEIAIHLQNSLDAKTKDCEMLERSLQSCESACMYHQERSEKAFEIIGRLVVDSEL